MKVGFVVECVADGPETKVIPGLAALVAEAAEFEIEPEIEPLGSKAAVLTDCGRYAKALLQRTKCDRVVIAWDARPPWKEEQIVFDLEGELLKAGNSLDTEGLLDDPRVNLLCIIEELEAWLLADGRGVTARINDLRGQHGPLKKRIPDGKKVEQIPWPKSRMERIFRTSQVRAYSDWHDAGRIAANIPDAGKLVRHSATFRKFKEMLTI